MKWNSVLWAISLALLSPGVWPAEHAAAQQLAFRRDVPAPVARGCTDVTAAPAGTAQDAAEAARLLASARQAALLGDPRAAEDLLANAAALDTAAANIAFLHARALEEIGEPDRAVSEYCRYLRLAPDAQDADDVRQLIDRIAVPVRPGIPEGAVARFRHALALADSARLRDAERAFSDVIAAAPTWPAPYYNRAVLRMHGDRRAEARADFEQVLALDAAAPDVAGIREWLAVPVTPARRYSAGAAFAFGLIPGAGHFYTGRPVAGTALLAIAGGAIAAGVLYQQRHVECLTVPQNNVCPASQVRAERIERPYLVPSLGVAAAAALLGALDAVRGARSRNAAAGASRGANSGASSGAASGGAADRVGSAVHVRADRIDVALFTLRF